MHAQGPRRLHVIGAIVDEKTLFRLRAHYFQAGVENGGFRLGKLHFRGEADVDRNL